MSAIPNRKYIGMRQAKRAMKNAKRRKRLGVSRQGDDATLVTEQKNLASARIFASENGNA